MIVYRRFLLYFTHLLFSILDIINDGISFSRTVRFNFGILNVCILQYSISIKLFSFVICFIKKIYEHRNKGHQKILMDFVSLFVSSLPNQSVFYIFVNGCIWLTWGLFNYYVNRFSYIPLPPSGNH